MGPPFEDGGIRREAGEDAETINRASSARSLAALTNIGGAIGGDSGCR